MSDWKNETCGTCEFYGSPPYGRCYRYPPSIRANSGLTMSYPMVERFTPACAEHIPHKHTEEK